MQLPSYIDTIENFVTQWQHQLAVTECAHPNLEVTEVTDAELRQLAKACLDELDVTIVDQVAPDFVRVLIIGQRMGKQPREVILAHLSAFTNTDAFTDLQNLYKGLERRKLH